MGQQLQRLSMGTNGATVAATVKNAPCWQDSHVPERYVSCIFIFLDQSLIDYVTPFYVAKRDR